MSHDTTLEEELELLKDLSSKLELEAAEAIEWETKSIESKPERRSIESKPERSIDTKPERRSIESKPEKKAIDLKAKEIKVEAKELRHFVVNCLESLPTPVKAADMGHSTDDLYFDIENIIKRTREDLTLLFGQLAQSPKEPEAVEELKDLNCKLELELAELKSPDKQSFDSRGKDIKEDLKELREYISNCLEALPIPVQAADIGDSTDNLYYDIGSIIRHTRENVTLLIGQIVLSHEELIVRRTAANYRI
jgi:hypothetical protein